MTFSIYETHNYRSVRFFKFPSIRCTKMEMTQHASFALDNLFTVLKM